MSTDWKRFILPSAVCAGAATLGALSTKVDSDWYSNLKKPAWQPPGRVFGPAWTTLYSLTAFASGRVLNRMPNSRDRRAYLGELEANMAVNVAWSWLFFSARRPDASLLTSAVLEASTLRLLTKAAKVDRVSAAALAPYAAWVGFATVLNAEILRLNPSGR
ncbi:TspO/MBR family protein [Brevibacterium sp. UCMA 11752]|uniref:TspO/MBR family protein n=1 Tax=Brevibacterium sp. UCMA 11752 TaxID=2745946 RepID=UPI001F3483BB|nr:TspO/MBR family protein [Brevibacterium sp. UCMA 11752]MCF2587146.1 tryptophan-rich sensory protein [Brevibacterium sp. UCMA 11752]